MKSRLTHLPTGVITDSNQIRVTVHSPAKHTDRYPACFEPIRTRTTWSPDQDEEVIWRYVQRKK